MHIGLTTSSSMSLDLTKKRECLPISSKEEIQSPKLVPGGHR